MPNSGQRRAKRRKLAGLHASQSGLCVHCGQRCGLIDGRSKPRHSGKRPMDNMAVYDTEKDAMSCLRCSRDRSHEHFMSTTTLEQRQKLFREKRIKSFQKSPNAEGLRRLLGIKDDPSEP